jgi:hypothetical protein
MGEAKAKAAGATVAKGSKLRAARRHASRKRAANAADIARAERIAGTLSAEGVKAADLREMGAILMRLKASADEAERSFDHKAELARIAALMQALSDFRRGDLCAAMGQTVGIHVSNLRASLHAAHDMIEGAIRAQGVR